MSYESKILIVDRFESETGYVFGQEIARFDLCSMGYDLVNGKYFTDMFTTPIDFNLYYVKHIDENDPNLDPDEWKTDMYGKWCNYGKIEDVLQWIENSESCATYRRATLFRDFLRDLLQHRNEYDNLVLVHFGY